jgi:hypothetical protein
MSGNWLHHIKHVTPGEPVDAGIVSRPDRTLEERTEYLKDRLDAAELGAALFDTDATVAEDVLPGQPVFWNSATQRYEQSIVVVEVDQTTQAFVTLPSSDCVGMCLTKKAADRADIVLRGLVTFPNLDSSVGSTVTPGRYFLSAVEPGKLSRQKPPVTVSVCHVLGPRDNCSDALRVIVMPQFKDYVDDHTHYKFDLVAEIAGSQLGGGASHIIEPDGDTYRHKISNGNAQFPGWLPADHPTFRRNPADPSTSFAPTGAVFGYNIGQHQALARVWPPIPMQSVAVLWDKGLGRVGATEVPLGPAGLVICDANGIWWLSDCYGDVPWPNAPNGGSASPTPECPRSEAMRVTVVFLRMLVGNDRTMVTSLEPADSSPIEVVNCDGTPARTGDLALDLTLQTIDCAPLGVAANGKVFINVVNKHQLKRGWVAEGLVAHGLAQLSLTSTHSRDLTLEEKSELDIPQSAPAKAHHGLVKINFADQFADKEVAPQIVRLNDAVERLYKDIPYLGLPGGQESSLRLRFNIPYINVENAASLQFKARVQLFGRGGQLTGNPTTLPPLTLSYRVLPAPGNTPIALVANDSALAFPADNSTIALLRDRVVEKDSAGFEVSPGDTVLVTILRAFDVADVYPEIGILRVSGILGSSNSDQ